jgi:outer membrane protein
MWKVIICCAVFLAVPKALAVDLWDIYQQAKLHDAKIQHAEADWLSACEILPQSTAALLPSLSMTANSTHNDLYSFDKNHYRYNSHGYNLSLNVPLINLSAISGRHAASWRVKSAGLAFVSAQQDLILRTGSAYFSVLLAREKRRIKRQEVAALQQQLNDAQSRFSSGFIPETNVYEIQVYLEQARSALVSYDDAVQVAENQLAIITNDFPDALKPMRAGAPFRSPVPHAAGAWVDFSKKNNADYLSSCALAEAADQDVDTRRRMHLPTLNAISSLGRTASHFVLATSTSGTQRNIGVQLGVPIYNGGQISSQVRQALFDRDKFVADCHLAYQRTIRGTKQLHYTVSANVRKINADGQALQAAQRTLDNMQESYRAGTRSVFDVLFAQQRVFALREQLAADKVDYLNNALLLKKVAGLLSEQDIYDINRQFF